MFCNILVNLFDYFGLDNTFFQPNSSADLFIAMRRSEPDQTIASLKSPENAGRTFTPSSPRGMDL